MTMTIYSSSDASAPTLQGVVGGALSGGAFAAGSLVELLRQVLVSGYGAKAGAGWTMPFTTTSRASFKQGAGCGFYLDVLDDGSLTAAAREAQFSGFEVMTAAGTGTNQFPTSSQQSTGLKVRKSDTADATTRPWLCFADNKTFYLYVMPQTGTQYLASMVFGNFHTLLPGDLYNCIAIGRVTSAAIDSLTNETLDLGGAPGNNANTAGHYMARGYNAIGVPVQPQKAFLFMSQTTNSQVAMGNQTALIPFPNPTDSTLLLSRVYLLDGTTAPTTSMRGWLRGFWCPWQSGGALPFNYTLNGIGLLSGKTFQVLGLRTGNAANGRFIMETSDTWDS